MKSGRSTPEPMKRPPRGPTTVSASSLQNDLGSSARLQEQGPQQQPPSTAPRPTVSDSRLVQTAHDGGSVTVSGQSNAQLSLRACLVQSLLQTWVGNLAAVQGCLLTAFGLGWAVSSRIIRLNHQAWTAQYCASEPAPQKDMLPEVRADSPSRNDSLPRIKTLHTAHYNDNPTPKSLERESSSGVVSPTDTIRNLHFDNGAEASDATFATHELLQKHFNYLMPWISSQPCDNNEDEMTSERTIADEFSNMSMQHFGELSTAIYRDVRRREQQPSPGDVQPPIWEQCIRNRQNEARMVLCRTINEQFHRLVLALVLEQARRLTELRIKLNRRAAMAERGALSPPLF